MATLQKIETEHLPCVLNPSSSIPNPKGLGNALGLGSPGHSGSSATHSSPSTASGHWDPVGGSSSLFLLCNHFCVQSFEAIPWNSQPFHRCRRRHQPRGKDKQLQIFPVGQLQLLPSMEEKQFPRPQAGREALKIHWKHGQKPATSTETIHQKHALT